MCWRPRSTVGRKIGKVPVVVGVCHGFVGNRMLRAASRNGTSCCWKARCRRRSTRLHRIRLPDGAVRDGRPRRPRYRLAHRARRKAQGAEIADALCELGRFGQKTGQAASISTKAVAHRQARSGSRGADRRRRAKRLGVEAPHDLRPEEIIERLLYPMINEGAQHPRGRHRAAAGRHRCDLGLRLRLPDLARRPDVLGRHREAQAVFATALKALAQETGDKRRDRAALLSKLADEGGTSQAMRRRPPKLRLSGVDRGPRPFIVSTARTPIGKAFRGLSTTHGATLGGLWCSTRSRAGIDPAEVEDVVLGCATTREKATGSNIARLAAIRAGLLVTVSGVTVNRFCSSGLQTSRDGRAAHHRRRGGLHRRRT